MVSLTRSYQKINAHMDAARAYAKLSYAVRLKVGAVIVRDDRIVSIGYNGTPSGRDNVCEDKVESELIFMGEPTGELNVQLVSKPEVCHAEMNAIMFAAKHGTSTDGCSLIVTHSPCFECAKMIVQCGIKHVYYDQEYRDLSSVNFLKECHVKVERVKSKTGTS